MAANISQSPQEQSSVHLQIARDEDCTFCGKPVSEGESNRRIDKGCDRIKQASIKRGVEVIVKSGQAVHSECRRVFCNKIDIEYSLKRKHDSASGEPSKDKSLRSSEPAFSYREHYLFCGKPDKYGGRKRDSDDLVSSKRQKLGRPKDSSRHEAFLKVAEYLEANDEEQTTIGDLIEKMKYYLGHSQSEAYGFSYMKDCLLEHFGTRIIITEINGKSNVVTFRGVASTMLHNFYNQKKTDTQAEKMRLIKTAAQLIKSDIKSIVQDKNVYPSSLDITDTETVTEYLPESLTFLLRMLFVGKDKDLKVGSIGQAIMQAARPRVLQAPLLLGLGVQMHFHFASRFLIDTLDSLGYSCSYSEVQGYERSAAITCGTDIPGYIPGQFIQYVADNVDHNIRTLDGKDTFHGMGIIANVTPKTDQASVIPRVNVSAEDIAQAFQVDVKHITDPAEVNATLPREIEEVGILYDRLIDEKARTMGSITIFSRSCRWTVISSGETPNTTETRHRYLH
ncbi:hypothetical protein ScPMuIL_001777 [Solemya velum]